MKKNILMPLLLIMATIKADVKIATFNVTHGYKNNWDTRKSGVLNLLKTINADIYGLQEPIEGNNQLASIKAALSNYECVGKPRSTGINGFSLKHRLVLIGIPFTNKKAQDEYCPIFYNKNKFECLETKTIGINGDGSGLIPRIYTMARLKETSTGKIFDVYNTHLDHQYEQTRLMQLKLIGDDIKNNSAETPTILVGDFNTEVTDDMKKILIDIGSISAKEKAQNVKGSKETHKKGSSGKLIECDHIIIRPAAAFNVKDYETHNTMSKITSDHNPVSMVFSFADKLE